MSSSSATSLAGHRSTLQRISTARWRAGRCCSAVTKARRIESRNSAISAGSAPSGEPWASGMGVTHSASGVGVPSERLVGRRRRTHLHRPGAALDLPAHVDADVRRDAIQPRPHAVSALRSSSAWRQARAASSPAPRPRPRSPSRASGSSSPVSSRRKGSRSETVNEIAWVMMTHRTDGRSSTDEFANLGPSNRSNLTKE